MSSRIPMQTLLIGVSSSIFGLWLFLTWREAAWLAVLQLGYFDLPVLEPLAWFVLGVVLSAGGIALVCRWRAFLRIALMFALIPLVGTLISLVRLLVQALGGEQMMLSVPILTVSYWVFSLAVTLLLWREMKNLQDTIDRSEPSHCH